MKSSLMSVFRYFIFAVAVTVSSFGATIYVSTTGSDSAAGTSSAPLATLSRALAIVKPGDTISLGAGTFGGNVNTSVAGTATSRITIQGAGVGSTIYTGGLTVDTSYYTVKNITFRGPSVTFTGVTECIMEDCEAYRGLNNLKIGGGSNCIARNNIFRRAGSNGMVNVSGTGHLLEGNTYSKNNGFDVHRVNGAIACIWRGNIFESIKTPNNNVTTSASAHTIGTGTKTFEVASGMGYEVDEFMLIESTASPTNYMRGWVVGYSGTKLTVEVGSTAGSGTFSTWTVEVDAHGNHADILQAFSYNSYDCIFENNRINNNSAQLGMFEANPDLGLGVIRDWTFRNNVFYNSRIQINIDAPGFKFYNNTVYNTSSTAGFCGNNSTKGNGVPILVYNNIFCRVGNIESAGPYWGANGNADYNLITDYVDDSTKTGYAEAHGINGGYTPSQIFVDPANGDLRLKTGSPALGAGVDLRTVTGLVSTLSTSLATTTWNIGATDTFISGGSTAQLPAPSNVRVSSTP